ncbi:MAG: zinc ribbon domain-containing protein [Leptonema sp. (in: Bacteria)]|nr:zinc ribbon domain-containing protein [Leptonema sp. (in: bacteria)]
MPTYSYRCKNCGHTYDAFQSIKAEPDTECPVCKGQVERLIGAGAGIVFKGSGFYVTDYKKTGQSTSTTTESTGSASSSASSSSVTKTDSSNGSSVADS